MSSLIIEFPLPSGSAIIEKGKLHIELGNSVRLTTEAPSWLKRVNVVSLQVVMDVEGSPHAEPSEPPVK